MTEPAFFGCDDFDRACTDYLSGQASEHIVQSIERHASSCARCELLLDNATRPTAGFAPALPPALRESVLRSIRSAPALSIVRDSRSTAAASPHVQRSRTVGRVAWSVVAVAAAVAVVMVQTRDEPATSGEMTFAVDSPTATPSGSVPGLDRDAGFEYTAARVASAQAQAEFEALDDAAQELEAALAQSPNDRELRAFLASVRARRDELTRRVREATS